jgi:alkyldihydroxyacetonephosphate synthase
MRPRKIWGWGYEGERADPRALAFAEASLSALLGGPAPGPLAPPSADAVPVPASRMPESTPIERLLERSSHERLVHALGRSYRDLARAVRGVFPHVPDAVAVPRSEDDLVQLCEIASARQIALVPFGGGTSVAGGVEPEVGSRFSAALSVDLRAMSGLLELDEQSLAARFGAGTLGPDLEAALRPKGMTLRHFPQSFEFSTLGGWVATRAGGHFATVYTHIDDLVAAIRMVTPTGDFASWPLPGSGRAPAPTGWCSAPRAIFGVITEATMRVRPRPDRRASASVRFERFEEGAEAG